MLQMYINASTCRNWQNIYLSVYVPNAILKLLCGGFDQAEQIQSALSFTIHIAWTDSGNANGVFKFINFTLQN